MLALLLLLLLFLLFLFFLLKGSRFRVLGLSCPDLWYIVCTSCGIFVYLSSRRGGLQWRVLESMGSLGGRGGASKLVLGISFVFFIIAFGLAIGAESQRSQVLLLIIIFFPSSSASLFFFAFFLVCVCLSLSLSVSACLGFRVQCLSICIFSFSFLDFSAVCLWSSRQIHACMHTYMSVDRQTDRDQTKKIACCCLLWNCDIGSTTLIFQAP